MVTIALGRFSLGITAQKPTLAAMLNRSRSEFVDLIAREREAHPGRTLAVPLAIRVLDDQLTPVLAYRRLVAADERLEPSFLLESVEGGERQGRHSIMGAQPIVQVIAYGQTVTIHDSRGERGAGSASRMPRTDRTGDPLMALREIVADLELVGIEQSPGEVPLPDCVLGGWFGYAGYETVRYAEPEKLSRDRAPDDDRNLPDLNFALYDGVVVFDHVDKLVHVITLAMVAPDDDAGQAYDATAEKLAGRVRTIEEHAKPLPGVAVGRAGAVEAMRSNITRAEHERMVARAQEYIRAGDIFQVVIGQRFERSSAADPFDVYRSLRAVNPSPYMVYLQTPRCILIASSPEILCRVRTNEDGARVLTNRPLAGTRPRGATGEEDTALERELLADPKERAEHVMLVDLGRNDVGQVCKTGTVKLERVMEIERYSHVMHISSTVTGELRDGLDSWDALRATLPVGTISGAPKIRAMQIIDELEKVRRGPYGGGLGYVGIDGEMDIALALRTIVVPTDMRSAGQWMYHVQAAGGIVIESQAEAEFLETVNKAAALGRAIDVAETGAHATGAQSTSEHKAGDA